MKDYRRWLLGELLDRYERSKHYRGESSRPVFLRCDPDTFPEYWDDSSAEVRQTVHAVARELAAAGLVRLRWAPLADGIELARIDLVLDRLDEVYRLAGRTPRRVQEEELAAVAEAWRGRLPDWADAFLDRLVAALRAGERLPAGFAAGEAELLDAVCRCIAELSGRADPVPRRAFSLRVLGDSKRFETWVERRLVRVAREFWPGAEGLEDSRDLLAELGIVENPDHLYLAGPLVLEVRGARLDLAPFVPDVGLPAALVHRARVVALPVQRVLTVENLTSFHQVALRRPAATLVIYLGGYHNRLRQEFLRRLWHAAPEAEFLHWGDIDLGGFHIFRLLRDGSGVPLRPWRMDRETYLAYIEYGIPFDEPYARKLAALQGDAAYEEFQEVLPELLRHRRRLEQECVEP